MGGNVVKWFHIRKFDLCMFTELLAQLFFIRFITSWLFVYGHGHTKISAGPLGPSRKYFPNRSTHSECNLCVSMDTRKMFQGTKGPIGKTNICMWGEGTLLKHSRTSPETYQHLQNSVFKTLCLLFPGGKQASRGLTWMLFVESSGSSSRKNYVCLRQPHGKLWKVPESYLYCVFSHVWAPRNRHNWCAKGPESFNNHVKPP